MPSVRCHTAPYALALTLALSTAVEIRAEPSGPETPDDPLPVGAYARLGSARLRHGDRLRAVAYSPDGKSLATAGTNHCVRLWDAVSGKPLRDLSPGDKALADPFLPSRWLSCVAFSPDGKTLAAGESEAGWAAAHSVRLWEVATGKALPTLTGNTGGVFAVAFVPGTTLLATAGGDRAVRLWDISTGRPARALTGHGGEVRSLAVSPDGKLLVAAGADGVVRFWDPSAGAELRHLDGQAGATVALSSDGKTLASAGAGDSVGLYEAATGKELRRVKGPTGDSPHLAFSPGGKELAVTAGDGAVHLFDPDTGKELRVLKGAHGPVASLTFAPDGKTLAAAVAHEAVRRWDVASGREIPPPGGGHWAKVGYLAFTPDGSALVSSGEDWAVRVWDAASGKELTSYPAAQIQGRTAALSPDGRLVAIARKSGRLAVVETRTGKEVREFSGHNKSVVTLTFHPGGERLASAGEDETVRSWDVTNGKALGQRGHAGAARYLAYAPDGKNLAYAGQEPTAVILEPTGLGRPRQLADHTAPVDRVAFSADARTLAAAGQDGTVTLWDVPNVNVLRRLTGHAGYVMAVAFSPDGRTVAAGCWRGVRVWEVASGRERASFPGHAGDTTALAFSPDGRTLASGGNDSGVLLWDVTGRRAPGGGLRPAELSAADLKRRWDDLAADDAAAAGRAVWELASVPDVAVPFLAERFAAGPTAPAEAEGVEALIAQLDDDDFDARERATAELEKLGRSAEAALRRALEKRPSGEAKHRLTTLVGRFAAGTVAPDGLRVLRTLEVLEQAGTPAAREALGRVAKGPESDPLAREARASLGRLEKRPVKP